MGDARTGTGGDRCVCCGEIIPEGRQVCPACCGEIMIDEEEADRRERVREMLRRNEAEAEK